MFCTDIKTLCFFSFPSISSSIYFGLLFSASPSLDMGHQLIARTQTEDTNVIPLRNKSFGKFINILVKAINIYMHETCAAVTKAKAVFELFALCFIHHSVIVTIIGKLAPLSEV